jgi:hypothetical protein
MQCSLRMKYPYLQKTGKTHPIADELFLCIYGFTALLLDLGRFCSLMIFHTIGRTPWTGDQLIARPLLTRRTTHRINAHKYPCLEWDSNPRVQCSSGRKQFMSQTARRLSSADEPVLPATKGQLFFKCWETQ